MTEDRYINPKNIDLKLGALEADGELLIPLSAVRAAIAAAPSEDVVALPCKVGDVVYIITYEDMLDIVPEVCEIFEDEISEMTYGRKQSGKLGWWFFATENGAVFYDTAIGKSVFKTREEAEIVLAEWKKKKGDAE